jgi:phosphatidylglycerophosphate synthase
MSNYEPTERRPIASRETNWARATASWLARCGIRPNAISLAGMMACILAGLALSATSVVTSDSVRRGLWLASAVLVQLRLLANLFDGMVALQTQQASPVGELYNEVPDRVSDTAALIGLGYASGGTVLGGYAAAIAAVFTAYVRAQAKAAGAPNDYCGPMAKQHRMFIVTVTAIVMAVLPVAMGTNWRLPSIATGIIVVGCALTSIRRLARAARALGRGAT